MTAVVDVVSLVNPSDGATGVPLNSQIKITFTTEIDTWSVENGGIIIEGPDSDEYLEAPSSSVIDQGSESQMLQSAGLKGLVPGIFTFQRVDLITNTLVSTLDTTGAGNLYRTRAVFTPTYPLRKLTTYNVYIVGGSDDDNEGLFTNTIFDTIDTGGNTSTGDVTFSGTYLGDFATDEFNIRITKSGILGTAEFESWKTSAPLSLEGPFLTSFNASRLGQGISVGFGEGIYSLNDTFKVKVKAPSGFTGNTSLSFDTGSGSISALPTSTSSSVLGDPIYTPSTGFSIVKTTPEDGDSNMSLDSTSRITIEFSSDIDVSTVSADSVVVEVEAVSDHPSLSEIKTGIISRTITVSGNKMFIDL